MFKKFKLPALPSSSLKMTSLKEPQVRLRALIGVLLVANLVAAVFAFHVFDASPEQLAQQVIALRQQTLQQTVRLNQAKTLASKVDKGRAEGDQFIGTYMTSRRQTYSTIISEINQIATSAHMKTKDALINLEAIQGTESLDMMTVTESFEGKYEDLVHFVNLLDKSKRFLIIESLSAAPQQKEGLQVTLKFNTFVKDDSNPS
jgi:type IV pilus assembly protein PilO